MNKKILYTFSLLVCLALGYVVYDVNHVSKEEYRELIDNHRLQERLKLTRQERKSLGLPPNRYFDDQYLLEMNPSTGLTYPENIQAINSLQTVYSQQEQGEARITGIPGIEEEDETTSSEIVWQERGPNNIGGRTRVVFYDPNDVTGKRVFAGGVTGGLWKNDDITDANSVWVQVGIDENLSISCYAIDPNDSDIWYVGTGESYSFDIGTGNGIWRSTDGGTTWSHYIETNLNQGKKRRLYFINQIVAWNNNGTTEVFYAQDGTRDVEFVGYTRGGWYKIVNDAGSQIVFDDADTSRDYIFSDVEIAVDNSLWIGTTSSAYGTGGGEIYRSTDGENFTQMYDFGAESRVELAVSKLNANTVYALAGVSGSTTLVKTTDGSTFTAISIPNDADSSIDADDFARNQGTYNLTLEVDPTNDAILYAGGIDLFRSSDSGANWNQISKWSNNNFLAALDVSLVHADQHVAIIDPNDSSNVIFANDGGIYYSSDITTAASSSTAIESRNNGYNITQFYSGAIGQDENDEMILGGAQDNGSLFINPAVTGVNAAVDVFSGDGVQEFIDKDGEYIVISYIYNTYSAFPLPLDTSTTTYKATEVEIVDEDTGTFINIADLDDNLDILYTYATSDPTKTIGRYSDLLGASGGPFATSLTDDLLSNVPTAIKVSPYTTDSSTLIIGTDIGEILKVTNADTTPIWTDIDLDSEINAGSISAINFGTNENEIFVTLHNYGVNNIYYTDDGGITWSEKDGDFADIPVKAIIMNPLNTKEVLIGTNAGVWKTSNIEDANPIWEQSLNGIPSVKITTFDIRTSDNTILAATYGRGMFTGVFEESPLLSNENIDVESEIEGLVVVENTLITDQELVLSSIDEVFELRVVTMNGQQVLQKQIDPSNGSSQRISVPFQSGIYIVNILYEGNVITKKIIIE